MPIRLIIDEQCQDCSEFEPDIEKNVQFNDYYDNHSHFTMCITEIRCAHACRCQSINRYLERQNRKKKEKNNVI